MTKPDDEIVSKASERESYLHQKDKNRCTFGGRKASSSSSDDVKLCFNLEEEEGLYNWTTR